MKSKRILLLGIGVAASAGLLSRFIDRESAAPHAKATSTSAAMIGGTADKPTINVGDHAIDLAGVMQRTRLAFQRRGGHLVGGDQTYGVLVSDEGIAFRPVMPSDPAEPSSATVAAPLELRTVSFGRDGGRQLPSTSYELDKKGQLVADLGEQITERLENREDGLEQSWELASPPRGKGDLVVRIAASGQSYAAATESGLHFRDPASGLGVAYSHATWVDASGASTRIVASRDGDQIVMRVPGSLVESSHYPVVLDPTVGPEYDLDTPIVGLAVERQLRPALGYIGKADLEYIVVWEDYRRDAETGLGGSDIYGAHVTTRLPGVIEPVGFLITDPDEGGEHKAPAIAGNSDLMVVAYTYNDSSTNQIRARAIEPTSSSTPPPTADVRVDDLAGVLCGGSLTCDSAKISANFDASGTAWYIAFTHGLDVAGAAFEFSYAPSTQTLTPTPGNRQVIANESYVEIGNSNDFGMASNRDEFLLVVGNGGPIYGVIVDNAGNLLKPKFLIFGGVNYVPSVDYYGNTDTWLVATAAEISAGDRDIRACEVDLSGMPYAITPIKAGPTYSTAPRVAGHGPNGTEALIAWQEGNPLGYAVGTVDFKTVESGASHVVTPLVSGSIGGTVFSAFGSIAMHSDEQNEYFVAWPDFQYEGDIYGARVSFAGAVQDPDGFPISTAAPRETEPAVACCDGQCLAVWTETEEIPGYHQINTNIYGSLIKEDGSVAVEHIPVFIDIPNQRAPAVACDGRDFFVVWEDDRNGVWNIYGEPVSSTGLVGGAYPIGGNFAVPAEHPSVAFRGDRYWVVWDYGGVSYATVYTPTMTISTPVVVSSSGASHPDLDTDGHDLLVVYQQRVDDTNHDIWANTIDWTGTVGTAFEIHKSDSDQRYPRVKFDGNQFYEVVFEDDEHFASDSTNINSRPVEAGTFSVGSEVSIATTPDKELRPKIGLRERAVTEVVFSVSAPDARFEYDVYGQEIANTTLTGSPYAISTDAVTREITPTIACPLSSSCIGVYRSYDALNLGDGDHIDRIKARLLSY